MPTVEVVSLRDVSHQYGISVQVAPPEVTTVGSGLAPDLEYNLDAAMECGDITADQRICVELLDDTFAPWFWSNLEDGHSFAPEVARRLEAWRLGAPSHDKLGVDWYGLGGIGPLFDDAALGVAWEVAEIAVAAGGDNAACDAAVARSACVPSAIRFMEVVSPLLGRVRTDVATHGREAFRAARNVIGDMRAQRMRSDLQRHARHIRDELDAITADLRSRVTALPKPSVSRKVIRQGRRVLTRSYALLSSVAGTERAKACLSGDEITVKGRRFDFRLRVRNARRATHGAVDVFVTDKDDVELAKLCVYMPDTPALDQVAGLILHVVAGEEDEIIKAANVISMTSHGTSHAAFRDVRGSRDFDGDGTDPRSVHLPQVRRPMDAMRERLAMPSRRAFSTHLASEWAWLGEATGDPGWVAALVGARDLETLGAPARMDLLAAARA